MSIHTYLVLIFLIILFLVCLPAKGDDNTALHCATSAAATGAIYMMVSGLFRPKTKVEKVNTLGFSFGFVQAMGVTYEIGDSISRNDRRLDAGDIGVNMICGAAMATGIALIEF